MIQIDLKDLMAQNLKQPVVEIKMSEPAKEMTLIKPHELAKKVGEYVIGNEDAIQTLSVAIYNHYKRINHNSKGNSEVEIDKSNILLIGGTGSGKTHIVKTMCKCLDIPYYIGDASTLTASGYVGSDVDTILSGLLLASNGNIEKAQNGLIILDECFTGDTEIMTNDGFKRFDELNDKEEVLQWNEDETMNFVTTERIIKKNFNGNLIQITRPEKKKYVSYYSHTSTPNHNRIVISLGKYGDKWIVKKMKANETPNSSSYLIPVSGKYDCPENPNFTDELIKFYVAFCADGCIKNGIYGYISFCKERKYIRLKEILSNLKIEYSENTRIRKNGVKYYNFYFGRMDTIGICSDGNKTFDRKILYSLSLRQRTILIEELRYWDGHTPPKTNLLQYINSKKEEMDLLQEICYISGYVMTYSPRRKGGYKDSYLASIRKKNTISQQKVIKKEIPYNGDVYCVTVPSGMIMIKQNGVIQITGNCDKIANRDENPSVTRDVNGLDVQAELLRLIEGTICNIQPGEKRKHPEKPTIPFDTTNVLFIFLGAFESIEKIIKKRMNIKRIGYKKDSEQIEFDENKIFSYTTPDDLRTYGFIRELIGRLPIITSTEILSKETLKDILTKPKNSITKQYQELFKMDGCKLTFDKDALDAIADYSIKNKSGARSLRATIEKILKEYMFDIPRTGRKTLTITEKIVKEKLGIKD